jgi:hypothetical protein
MSFEGKIGPGGPVVMLSHGLARAVTTEHSVVRRPMGSLSVIDASGIHHARIIDRLRHRAAGAQVVTPRIFDT